MRKVITAILVDPNLVEELRSRKRSGKLSYSEIFDVCDHDCAGSQRLFCPWQPGQRVRLTPLRATEFEASGFGHYAGLNRMILAMCRRDFGKVRDLSAVTGFERVGETEGKPISLDAGWIQTFLRDRFEKGRRCL